MLGIGRAAAIAEGLQTPAAPIASHFPHCHQARLGKEPAVYRTHRGGVVANLSCQHTAAEFWSRLFRLCRYACPLSPPAATAIIPRAGSRRRGMLPAPKLLGGEGVASSVNARGTRFANIREEAGPPPVLSRERASHCGTESCHSIDIEPLRARIDRSAHSSPHSPQAHRRRCGLEHPNRRGCRSRHRGSRC
jgi:hypothetical protein